jgi:mannose-1-phosphate guanylyltransferase
MILAAGLGTRLRPYTLARPKPLFPVVDKPLLLRSLEQLHRAGFGEVVVNAHHLREQIVAAVAGRKGTTVQVEDDILGTGGGLRLACPYFDDAPVLVVNGDIFHTIDLSEVYEQHCRTAADVTMVLHDYPRFNQVLVGRDDLIAGFGEKETGDMKVRCLAFTGIHVVQPSLLERIPAGAFHNIIDLYRSLIGEGKKVRALIARDHYWSDIGTPEDYLLLHQDILLGRLPDMEETAGKGPHYLGENVSLSTHEFRDWVCVGSNARIGSNARLTRVVVWDGAQVPDGARLSDAIVI